MQVGGGETHFSETSINKLTSELKFPLFPRENWEIPVGEAYFVSLISCVRLPDEED